MQRVRFERDRFVDAHTLQVDEHTLVRAQRIVIATGSSPNVASAWRSLPASVAVQGVGVIALELPRPCTDWGCACACMAAATGRGL
jgi:pyruvate/2-oxoglutarate dehydrogenase complex dihydrolipoamide dehydrogenase (E3) component